MDTNGRSAMTAVPSERKEHFMYNREPSLKKSQRLQEVKKGQVQNDEKTAPASSKLDKSLRILQRSTDQHDFASLTNRTESNHIAMSWPSGLYAGTWYTPSPWHLQS